MSTQSPRLEAHRYFFALLPDADVAGRIHDFAGAALGGDGPGGRRLTRPERLHVTLALTPDTAAHDPALVAALLRAGASVAGEAPPPDLAPFDLVVDQLSGSARATVLLPSHVPPALVALQSAIARAMAAQDAPMRPGWRFAPHVTLAYGGHEAVDRPADGLRWTVRDFVLLESLVGLGRYECLGRWSLPGAPPAPASSGA